MDGRTDPCPEGAVDSREAPQFWTQSWRWRTAMVACTCTRMYVCRIMPASNAFPRQSAARQLPHEHHHLRRRTPSPPPSQPNNEHEHGPGAHRRSLGPRTSQSKARMLCLLCSCSSLLIGQRGCAVGRISCGGPKGARAVIPPAQRWSTRQNARYSTDFSDSTVMKHAF